MEVPNLPTDNLYKFMAIAGVVLVVFGLSFPLRIAGKLQLQLIEARTEVDLSRVRADRLSERVERWKAMPEQTPEQAEKFRDDLQLLREKSVQDVGLVSKVGAIFSQLIFLIVAGSASTLYGYILARRGFKLWYERVQRPNDLRLAKDSSSPEQDT